MSKKSDVGQWLERQYLLWRMREGQKKTWGDWAEYLGVARGSLDKWNRGDREPDKASVELLADRTGDDEIYDLVGVPRPDPTIQAMKRLLSGLSEEQKRKLLAEAERMAARRERGENGGTEPV